MDLAEAIDIFRAGVPDAQDADDEHFEVDDVASLDDVFAGSASEFSRSGASTEATVVPREKPRRMADLFGEIMGEAAAIKGIPMPAPPLAPMSDDMQGECLRLQLHPRCRSSSRSSSSNSSRRRSRGEQHRGARSSANLLPLFLIPITKRKTVRRNGSTYSLKSDIPLDDLFPPLSQMAVRWRLDGVFT